MESFDQFRGNEEIKKGLTRALTKGRLPHSLLFFGPSGVGKKTFAILLARAITCGGAGARPCGSCPSCKLAITSHPDIQLIAPEEGKRTISIDDIRSLIKGNTLRPFMGKYKVFIIDEADKMTPEAANAFLKVLEEPTDTTHFILITTKYLSLLPTIRSRCQAYRFKPFPVERLAEVLREGWGKDKNEAEELAKISQGRIGIALSLDLAETRRKKNETLSFLSRALSKRSIGEQINLAQELTGLDREEFLEKIDLFKEFIRDAIILSTVGETRLLINSKEKRLEQLATKIGIEGSDLLLRLEKMGKELSANVNPKYIAKKLLLSLSEIGCGDGNSSSRNR